ncbi:MAG: hypothetical protein Ct9H300mP8_10050 [Gammaproteobacteria bacterium]|nr:MAG: hypothetical protein Ct9H300mP8_10050 [Gammaproteobacteria bacterium]
MAVRRIIRMGHPTLRREAEPIAETAIGDNSFSNLINDMRDTLRDYGGIGLAAPQIDESVQLVIIDLPGGESRYGDLEALPLSICINPVVTTLKRKPRVIGKGVYPSLDFGGLSKNLSQND